MTGNVGNGHFHTGTQWVVTTLEQVNNAVFHLHWREWTWKKTKSSITAFVSRQRHTWVCPGSLLPTIISIFVFARTFFSPLFTLRFKEESLNLHPDVRLLLRGQPLKHFHKAHEIVFITVLWLFDVCLNSSVTFCNPWLGAFHLVCSVTFMGLSQAGSPWQAAARSSAVFKAWAWEGG